jgi:hypothetical protein
VLRDNLFGNQCLMRLLRFARNDKLDVVQTSQRQPLCGSKNGVNRLRRERCTERGGFIRRINLSFPDNCPDRLAIEGFCQISFLQTVYDLDFVYYFTGLKDFKTWPLYNKVI